MKVHYSKKRQIANSVGLVGLRDGVYQGKWSGYLCNIFANGKNHTFNTTMGIRGMADVMVNISGGMATIQSHR